MFKWDCNCGKKIVIPYGESKQDLSENFFPVCTDCYEDVAKSVRERESPAYIEEAIQESNGLKQIACSAMCYFSCEIIKTETFKLVIAGSRDFSDYATLKEKCDSLLKNVRASGKEICIISGGAKGADRLGERYALDTECEVEHFIPDWEKFGKRAGHLRNEEMAKVADAVVIFNVNNSKGSLNMEQNARGLNVPVRVYHFSN